MGRACGWPSWIRQPVLWKFFYLDDMATWCRTRTCKPSIPNAWPHVWFTRGRVLNQTPASLNLRDNRSFILNNPYRYGRSESATEIGSTGGHILSELEEDYPYAVVAADRISIGRHRWCILHIEKEGSAIKVLIENDVFQRQRNYSCVCVCVCVCVWGW